MALPASAGRARLRGPSHAGDLRGALHQRGDAAPGRGVRSGVSGLALDGGDIPRAEALLEESLFLCRRLGERWVSTLALSVLAALALRRGDWDRARTVMRESLVRYRDVGNSVGMANCLEVLAVAATQREPLLAARLFGAGAAVYEVTGSPRPPLIDSDCERALAHLRTVLGEGTSAFAVAAGRRMALEDAVDLGLGREVGARAVANAPM